MAYPAGKPQFLSDKKYNIYAGCIILCSGQQLKAAVNKLLVAALRMQ